MAAEVGRSPGYKTSAMRPASHSRPLPAPSLTSSTRQGRRFLAEAPVVAVAGVVDRVLAAASAGAAASAAVASAAAAVAAAAAAVAVEAAVAASPRRIATTR